MMLPISRALQEKARIECRLPLQVADSGTVCLAMQEWVVPADFESCRDTLLQSELL